MCYQESYNCVVSCLNSDLNMTNINNNIISSVGNFGNGCKIMSCNIIPITESTMFDTIFNIPIIPLIIIFGSIIGICCLVYLYWITHD
jgi:hypothetical protein